MFNKEPEEDYKKKYEQLKFNFAHLVDEVFYLNEGRYFPRYSTDCQIYNEEIRIIQKIHNIKFNRKEGY